MKIRIKYIAKEKLTTIVLLHCDVWLIALLYEPIDKTNTLRNVSLTASATET